MFKTKYRDEFRRTSLNAVLSDETQENVAEIVEFLKGHGQYFKARAVLEAFWEVESLRKRVIRLQVQIHDLELELGYAE